MFAGSRARIDVPTLVLWGDTDRYLEPWLADAASRFVPHATVRHFANASHWVMVDRPDEITRAIIEYAA